MHSASYRIMTITPNKISYMGKYENSPKTLGAQVHKKSTVRRGALQSLVTHITENLKIQFQKNLQIILNTTKILKN